MTTVSWATLEYLPKTNVFSKSVHFLFDEYDELCPQQAITFTGDAKAKTRKGMIDIKTYQHTGTATMPGVFYVDAAGRVLWQGETYDRIVRDDIHLWNCVQYIGSNPAEAGLANEQWRRWLSPAWRQHLWHFRDEPDPREK